MRNRKIEIVCRTQECTGCGRCVRGCRRHVLRLAGDGRERFVEVADAARCAGCRHCERSCPHGAIIIKTDDTMKEKWRFAALVVGGISLLAALVAVAMWLWNALIPDIFGWSEVTYWQALGLLVLFHLLFGHLAHPLPDGRRKRLHEMMHGMSRDERREFIRRRMRTLCNEERIGDERVCE